MSDDICTVGQCTEDAAETYDGRRMCTGHANTSKKLDDAPVNPKRTWFGQIW